MHGGLPTRIVARMKHRTALIACVVGVSALAACGDDSVFREGGSTSTDIHGTLDPSAPGVTGTVPLPGPIYWVEWSPAQSPDPATEAELVAGLEELRVALMIPDSPSPTGEETSALANSWSLGWGSGHTFADTTSITLNVMAGNDTLVLIEVLGCRGDCPEGFATLTFRGDPAACAGEARVRWREAGECYGASFGGSLSLEAGLSWVEAWRLLP